MPIKKLDGISVKLFFPCAIKRGKEVGISVAEGGSVAEMSALSPQAGRKNTKSTINKSVNFIETQLYPQAV